MVVYLHIFENYYKISKFFWKVSMFVLLRLLIIFALNLYSAEFFTVSICTTSTYENAKACEKNYLKNISTPSKIIQDGDKFRTVCGFFKTSNQAHEFKNTLDSLALSQGAFVKKIEIEDKHQPINKTLDENKTEIKNTNIRKLPERKTHISTVEEPKIKKLFIEKSHIADDLSKEVGNYDYIDILVDSSVNQMTIKAFQNGKEVYFKSYVVSTARKNTKKPQGVGKITQIAINPTWYPTPKTISYFKQKGIDLPSAVPPGHPQNYMGSAKINLTHSIDGKTIYRIHGTLNDKTIGSYESSGCIRMKNKDAVEVASMLLKFSKLKNKDKINVVLRWFLKWQLLKENLKSIIKGKILNFINAMVLEFQLLKNKEKVCQQSIDMLI